MKYVKFLVIPVLFVALAFMTIGGCGSSGGGGDTGCCVIGPDACIDGTNQAECDLLDGELDKGVMCSALAICGIVPPPTDPPPTNPPPTNPPPTNPPSQCQVPALDTDFSDLLFFFIDVPNNILIGVTSTGEDVIIAIADIIIDPLIIGLFAIPIGPNLAIIDTAIIEGLLFLATGDAVRVDNGSVFQIIDLIIADLPLGVDIEGECDSVEPIVTSSTETLRNVLLNMKTRGLLEEDGSGDSSNHIINFADELLPPKE